MLTIYGNNAWAEQQIKQSIDLYRHLGQPPITEYHIRIQGHQATTCIADQIVHLALNRAKLANQQTTGNSSANPPEQLL